MFVLKSKYDAMVQEYKNESKTFFNAYINTGDRLEIALAHVEMYKNLVTQLEEQLANQRTHSGFTNEEIQALIRLCHPDKHNKSDTANGITKKLLSMRNK